MKITRKSEVSGQENTMDLNVTQEQLTRWKHGELIQNVMPQLTPDEREFLLTGIMPDEWEDIFSDNEEEDSEEEEPAF